MNFLLKSLKKQIKITSSMSANIATSHSPIQETDTDTKNDVTVNIVRSLYLYNIQSNHS